MTTISTGAATDLGPALREARLSQDLTQSALAELAAVGRQWLSAFEAGDKPSAPIDMVLRLITILGVSVTLTGDTRPTPLGDAGEDLVDLDALIDGVDA